MQRFEACITSSVVYTQLTGGRIMRLDVTERIAKIFNQIVVGGVGDYAQRGQHGTVIEDVTSRLDVSTHALFVISQSHSVEICIKPVQCANG